MLANHTSIASLFKQMLDQFDKLKKKNAFLDQYKKERMFENGLEEFDDARFGHSMASGIPLTFNAGRRVRS
jgi:tubulin gamma